MTEKFKVRIAFLDVGQGDTIVVSIPEKREAVVVDCVDAKAVVNYLEREAIESLRGLVITHLHLDHYKEAVEFLNNCERELGLFCERVLFNWRPVPKSYLDKILQDTDKHSDVSDDPKINKKQRLTSFTDLKRWLDTNHERCGTLSKQDKTGRLQLRGSINDVIELLHPRYAQMGDLLHLNNTSGILKIQGLSSTALLMGDLEFDGWKYLQSKPVDIQSDVLKFPHHGAWKNADPNVLLEKIDPSVIVISVGTKGIKYKHPNSQVFKAIAERNNTHLLCTQATQQCTSDIPKKSKRVKQLFRQENSTNADNFFVEQSGCPCAGTVIIELGESVSILQPRTEFHQDVIIKPHFETPRCKNKLISDFTGDF